MSSKLLAEVCDHNQLPSLFQKPYHTSWSDHVINTTHLELILVKRESRFWSNTTHDYHANIPSQLNQNFKSGSRTQSNLISKLGIQNIKSGLLFYLKKKNFDMV